MSDRTPDAASILRELKTTLVSAAGGAIGRTPIVANLVEESQRLLESYANAVGKEKTLDTLRLDFILTRSGSFDLMVSGKVFRISSRHEIDEAISAEARREVDELLDQAGVLKPSNAPGSN